MPKYRQIHAIFARLLESLPVEPLLERRQILPPVDRAVGQVLVPVRRTAGDLIEVRQVVRSDVHGLEPMPRQQRHGRHTRHSRTGPGRHRAGVRALPPTVASGLEAPPSAFARTAAPARIRRRRRGCTGRGRSAEDGGDRCSGAWSARRSSRRTGARAGACRHTGSLVPLPARTDPHRHASIARRVRPARTGRRVIPGIVVFTTNAYGKYHHQPVVEKRPLRNAARSDANCTVRAVP